MEEQVRSQAVSKIGELGKWTRESLNIFCLTFFSCFSILITTLVVKKIMQAGFLSPNGVVCALHYQNVIYDLRDC